MDLLREENAQLGELVEQLRSERAAPAAPAASLRPAGARASPLPAADGDGAVRDGAVRVAISSLGVFEPFAPPFNLRVASADDNVTRGLDIVAAAAAGGARLVLLPEIFHACGVDLRDRRGAMLAAEPPLALGGADAQPAGAAARSVVQRVCAAAKAARVHVVFGLLARDAAVPTRLLRNRAVVVDDEGVVIGSYCKAFPTEREIALGVAPGRNGDAAVDARLDARLDARTVRTKLGVVGLAISFDLNWPRLWVAMKRDGAQIACWLSGYPGGLPLRMRALASELPIVTSVQGTRAAKYIDAAGRVRCATSRWQRMALVDVNVHQRLVHTDGSHVALRGAPARDSLLALQRACGESATVSALDEEHFALIEWHGESSKVARTSNIFEDPIIRGTSVLRWHGESSRESRPRAATLNEASSAPPAAGRGYAEGGGGSGPGAQAVDAALTAFRASVLLTVDDAIDAFSLRRYGEYVAECSAAVAAARADISAEKESRERERDGQRHGQRDR